jgi:hypothetical protein
LYTLFWQAAGAPIGAALLTHLDARYVEFCMASVLMLVICLQVHLLEKLKHLGLFFLSLFAKPHM